MHRRAFLKNGCTVCLSATVLSAMAASCNITQYASGTLVKDGITLNKNDFAIKKNQSTAYSSFIIVRNDALLFPICIYRFDENEYCAIWMKCAHQGAELNASGDKLQCPAHGSEYNNKGEVTHGPATSNLRTFPVIIRSNELFIDLRKES